MPGNFRYPIEQERQLADKLRMVAHATAGIIASYTDGHTITDPAAMQAELERYTKRLEPWARRTVARVMADVDQHNLECWDRALGMPKRPPKRRIGLIADAAPTGVEPALTGRASRTLGRNLRTHFARSVVGVQARAQHEGTAELITSLPREAGIRAVQMARQAELDSTRASYVARELARTEEVTQSRATLIARTEIAKANWTFTKARAEYVGATHYYWRTMEDEAVRESHAAVDGMVFAFDDPPEIEGEGAHGPGDFPNCRCYPEPIIDQVNAPVE